MRKAIKTMQINKLFLIYLICFLINVSTNLKGNPNADSVESKISKFELFSESQLKLKMDKGSNNEKIAAGYLLGKIFYNKKDFQQSFESFNNVLENYKSFISIEFIYKLKVNCGLALQKNRQFEQSLQYLKSAGFHLDPKAESDEYALLINNIANTYFEWGKYDTASIYFQNAEVLLTEAKNEKPLAVLYNNLGAIAHFYHLSETAISYYQKSEIIAEKYNLKTELANSIINLGIEYTELKQNNKAAEQLRKALSYSRTIQYLQGEIYALNAIARLFTLRNDYKTALELMQKSDSILQRINDIDMKIIVLNNMATLYKLMKQFDKALLIFNRIIELQHTNNLNSATTELNMGEIYKLQNNISKALEYLNLSLQHFLVLNNKFGLCSVNFQFSEIYLKQNNVTKAREILLNLLDEIKKEDLDIYDEIQSGIYLRLSDLFHAQNDASNALFYYKEYEKLKSAGLDKSFAFELAKIQNDSKLFQLDAQIKLLNAKNDSKTLEIKYQRRISYTLILIIIVFIGLSLFLYKIYNDKNKLYTELVKRNLELSKQAPFQEVKDTLKKITDVELDKSKAIINELIQLFERDKIYLQRDIGLIEVANQLDTNRTYLSKAIRDILDTNFNLLINKYRIEQARKMLTDPTQKLSIEGIAYNVGFSSKSTFNVAFKNLTGLTPSYLRDEVLKNQSVNT